jgi:hypothetical protein
MGSKSGEVNLGKFKSNPVEENNDIANTEVHTDDLIVKPDSQNMGIVAEAKKLIKK